MAQESGDGRLDSLLQRLRTAIRGVDEAEGIDPEAPNRRIFPPAPAADITAAERRLGFNLPPSYRAFLSRHNGWMGFDSGDLCIFGVSGPGYKELRAELDRYLRSLTKVFARRGREYAEELRERQKSDSSVIYLPDHPAFGLNFNGDYWVFDRNRPKRNGEFEAALVRLGDTVEFRWPSFLDFVDYTVRQVEAQVPAGSKASRSRGKSSMSTGRSATRQNAGKSSAGRQTVQRPQRRKSPNASRRRRSRSGKKR